MASYQQVILGEMETNCYVVWDEDSRESMVIDPADNADVIGDFIMSHNLELKIIGLTHGHYDHLMAAAELKWNFKTSLAMNFEDLFLWQRQTKTANHFSGGEYLKLGEMTKIDLDLGKTTKIFLGRETIEVIKYPGHTPGSVGFYLPNMAWIFSGDLVGQEGEGSTNYGYGDKKLLDRSLKKLKSLPKETLIFPGHGGSFRVGTLN